MPTPASVRQTRFPAFFFLFFYPLSQAKKNYKLMYFALGLAGTLTATPSIDHLSVKIVLYYPASRGFFYLVASIR